MSEYLAIFLVAAGTALFMALFTIVLYRKVSSISAQLSDNMVAMEKRIEELSHRISKLQLGVKGHGKDLEAIRAEFAMHVTRDNNSGVDYELAIKAAIGGAPAAEICHQFGLRDAEAKLLVGVYGGQHAS